LIKAKTKNKARAEVDRLAGPYVLAARNGFWEASDKS